MARGYANEYLELEKNFNVALGRILFIDTRNILTVDGTTLLSITKPTKKEPMKLNAKFFDDDNNISIKFN